MGKKINNVGLSLSPDENSELPDCYHNNTILFNLRQGVLRVSEMEIMLKKKALATLVLIQL